MTPDNVGVPVTAMLANRVVLEALSGIAFRRTGGTYNPARNVLDR